MAILRPPKKVLSQRKLEQYDKYSKVIQWGRAHPVEFADLFFGMKLLDMQKYAIYNTWFCNYALWLEARNAGKTTKLAVYTMLRSMLLPYHVTYFLGNTGAQAKEVFKKIEDITRHTLQSFKGITDVFGDEIVSSQQNPLGFCEDRECFHFDLYNGSSVRTLNSNVINIKGKRANLVCFDESGWFSDEMFIQAENFTNQDSNFMTGEKVDMRAEPSAFPRQLLYASSASDTNSGFYKKFRTFSKNMIMGDRRYFACNYTIDMVMKAKLDGEEYPPLISQENVDKALEENHDKALRELYNRFSADMHDGQILTRRDIHMYTETIPPVLENPTGKSMYALAWDSARLNDNSVICIAEFIHDDTTGWHMKLCNVVSLVDVDTKNKTPKRIPEQVEDFKELLLKYNGSYKGRLDYENIKAIVCDSGAGGQMVGGIADYLMEEWNGKDGRVHKGLIDRTHKSTETARTKYPDAVDIFRLIDPQKNRNAIFDALERSVKLGIVSFPADYDGKDRLYYIDDDGNEIDYALSWEEQLSLAQIELLKTEIITMCKYESFGNVSYNYPADKRNIMHDDRVFAFGLLCLYLMQLRSSDVYHRKVEHIGLDFAGLSRRPGILPTKGGGDRKWI